VSATTSSSNQNMHRSSGTGSADKQCLSHTCRLAATVTVACEHEPVSGNSQGAWAVADQRWGRGVGPTHQQQVGDREVLGRGAGGSTQCCTPQWPIDRGYMTATLFANRLSLGSGGQR
jgi:hypothetical protein